MLIGRKVRLGRIAEGTWRHGLWVVCVALVAFAANHFLFKPYFSFPALIPTVLGTALAFFIGFNNNQAYGRWWEGRIIWGGLVNESRTWARLCVTQLAPDVRQRLVRRQLAFILELKEFLRGADAGAWKAYLPEAERDAVAAAKNRHNAILLLQGREVQELYAAKAIDGWQLQELQRTLGCLTNEMGKAERIKSTVFPTTYNYYTFVFVMLFIVSATAVIEQSIGPWAILFGTLIGYVFVTIHTIGQALLEPFVAVPTGLALDQISRNIEISLLEMLGEKELPAPVQSVNGEYVL